MEQLRGSNVTPQRIRHNVAQFAAFINGKFKSPLPTSYALRAEGSMKRQPTAEKT